MIGTSFWHKLDCSMGGGSNWKGGERHFCSHCLSYPLPNTCLYNCITTQLTKLTFSMPSGHHSCPWIHQQAGSPIPGSVVAKINLLNFNRVGLVHSYMLFCCIFPPVLYYWKFYLGLKLSSISLSNLSGIGNLFIQTITQILHLLIQRILQNKTTSKLHVYR